MPTVQEQEDRWLVIEHQEQHQATTGRRTTGRPARTTSSEHEQLLIQLLHLRSAVRYPFAQLRNLFEVVVLAGARTSLLLGYQARREELQTVLEEAIQAVPTALQHNGSG